MCDWNFKRLWFLFLFLWFSLLLFHFFTLLFLLFWMFLGERPLTTEFCSFIFWFSKFLNSLFYCFLKKNSLIKQTKVNKLSLSLSSIVYPQIKEIFVAQQKTLNSILSTAPLLYLLCSLFISAIDTSSSRVLTILHICTYDSFLFFALPYRTYLLEAFISKLSAHTTNICVLNAWARLLKS